MQVEVNTDSEQDDIFLGHFSSPEEAEAAAEVRIKITNVGTSFTSHNSHVYLQQNFPSQNTRVHAHTPGTSCRKIKLGDPQGPRPKASASFCTEFWGKG